MLSHRSLPALFLVGAVVLACAEQAAPSSADPAPPSVDAPEGLTTTEIAQAIALRREFGLRADEGWVREVAANPAAVMDFGVPLLPFERDEIMGRPNGGDELTSALHAYLAEHADVSGGIYIDQARGGIVTVLVTDDPKPHEDAIARLIGPDTAVAVRQVRWTEADLNELHERIVADQAFLQSLPARMKSTATDTIANVVELSISSAVPDAAERIIAHFGAQGRLRVVSDGTGVLLQPTGRILGRILAPPGTDFTNLSPQFEADVDIGARDAMGIPVLPDGTFVIERLPPATYTVTILEFGDVGNTEVGRGTVVVPPGAVVALEIPLDRP